MQDVAARIRDIENSLEKIKQLSQNVQEKPLERQLDLTPAFDEHVRKLMQVQELMESSSNRLHELPR